MMNKEEIKKIIDEWKQIQLETGSHDEYGRGMYNGMEFLESVFTKEKPRYLNKDWVVKDEKD